jgi:hypothetical protein
LALLRLAKDVTHSLRGSSIQAPEWSDRMDARIWDIGLVHPGIAFTDVVSRRVLWMRDAYSVESL